eukprot:7652192-Pyramimonas_sp.AAC.1
MVLQAEELVRRSRQFFRPACGVFGVRGVTLRGVTLRGVRTWRRLVAPRSSSTAMASACPNCAAAMSAV